MATVELTIAGRRHDVACREGDEAHFRHLASLIDAKAADAARAMGGMGEARQLLFAALMLADELSEARAALARPAPQLDPAFAMSVEHLAERLEQLATRLPPLASDGVETLPAST